MRGVDVPRWPPYQGHRSPRLKVIASNGGMLTGSSSFAVTQLERPERKVRRVDEPQVEDAREGVDGPFLVQVDLARGG